MNLQSEKTRETVNLTWAGKYRQHPRSFQWPEMPFLLTFPFIERAYRTSGLLWPGHIRLSNSPRLSQKDLPWLQFVATEGFGKLLPSSFQEIVRFSLVVA
jgi:hypothetical protein